MGIALPFVVTIDGPAGSGKSTVARKVAKRLGFIHLNSGFLFRALGLIAKERNLDLRDDGAMTQLALAHQFRFELDSTAKGLGETRFTVDGRDLTDRIRSEDVGELASTVAVLPGLRDVFLRLQRAIAENQALVVEGRDSGSVVFPDARFKFYLDAPLDERARRRLKELQAANSKMTLEECRLELERRDKRDSSRAVAPHVVPQGARRIETGNLSIEQVVEQIADEVGEVNA